LNDLPQFVHWKRRSLVNPTAFMVACTPYPNNEKGVSKWPGYVTSAGKGAWSATTSAMPTTGPSASST
jgi:hypothetical protein